MTEAKPKRPRNELLDNLITTYAVFRECKPLAIGIHKAISEKTPDIDRGQLRSAMKIHTAATRYLKALASAEVRYDLDGNAAGEVTAEQREQAATTLKERFKRDADRRKAEVAEKKKAAEELEKAAQRQESLLKLAAKFNVR
jgi:ProP effector